MLQETWKGEHQLPQVFSDPLTKSDEQSRKLDEAGVSLGECYSNSASTEVVEHTCPASSADPVQQDPCVPPVQICQILNSSTLLETSCSGYLSSHSSKNSATTLSTVHLFLLLAILQTFGVRSLLKVIEQSLRKLCRSLLQQSANCGSQKE